jgi:hypothetical protein
MQYEVREHIVSLAPATTGVPFEWFAFEWFARDRARHAQSTE